MPRSKATLFRARFARVLEDASVMFSVCARLKLSSRAPTESLLSFKSSEVQRFRVCSAQRSPPSYCTSMTTPTLFLSDDSHGTLHEPVGLTLGTRLNAALAAVTPALGISPPPAKPIYVAFRHTL